MHMNDNFNKNLRNAFDQAEDDFNPEIIWEGINDKMKPAKKDKRRFFFFWIIGLGIGLLIFAFYYYSNNNSTALTTEHKESTEEKIVTRLYESISLPSSDNELVSTNKIKNATSDTYSKDLLNNKSEINLNTKEVIEIEKSIEILEKATAIEPSFRASLFNKDLLIKQSVTPHTLSLDPINPIETSIENRLTNDHINYPTHELVIRKSNEIPFDSSSDHPILKVKEPRVKKAYIKNIEMYSGIALGSKVSTSTNTEYTTNRNNIEEVLEQLALGIRAQVVNYNGFSFWCGVKYSMITDSWKTQYQYNEDLPYTYLEYTTEDLSGDIQENFTTDIVAYDVNRRVVQYNKEQIISIPLEIRYETQLNRWSFSPILGLEFSYLFGANHTTTGLDGFPIVEAKIGQLIAPSAFGGLNTSYAITPCWKITAGLNYRVLNIDNSTIIPDLNSTYKLYGLEIGIGKRF